MSCSARLTRISPLKCGTPQYQTLGRRSDEDAALLVWNPGRAPEYSSRGNGKGEDRLHRIITHRNNIENLTYDTLAGRIMKIDLPTGKILGAMESPGHWIEVSQAGEIFIGSLTGNVFRWYPGWLDRGLGVDEGITSP